MTQHSRDDLWRDFPKTATEFERRFATEEDCRAYWIKARWGGKPACARCGSTDVWPIREGTTFECRDCDHQTSLTALRYSEFSGGKDHAQGPRLEQPET
jgi:hypothetical protein